MMRDSADPPRTLTKARRSKSIETVLRFVQPGLAPPVLRAVDEIGYEVPSPIQSLAQTSCLRRAVCARRS